MVQSGSIVVGADLARITDLPVTLLSGRFPEPASTTEVAVTLDNLGLLLTLIGEPHAARELHQRALSIKLAATGPIRTSSTGSSPSTCRC